LHKKKVLLPLIVSAVLSITAITVASYRNDSRVDGNVTAREHDSAPIVPLTEKLRHELKQQAKVLFEGRLRNVYFLLVDQVHFADGTVFRNDRISNSLSSYLSDHYCESEP